MNIQTILKWASKRSPEILTSLGCVGVGVTGYLAGKGAIKASYVYNQLAKYDDEEKTKTRKEKFQRKMRLAAPCIKYYIPAAISGVATVASILGLHRTMSIRHMAVAASYVAADSALNRLQDSVKETLGEKKSSEIFLNSSKKAVAKMPDEEDIPNLVESGEPTGHEKALIYDAYSGRYFKSSIEHLKRIEADMNADLMKHDWVPINQIYDAIGLKPITLGDDLGFKFEIDDISSRIEFNFESDINDNGDPYIILVMGPKPKWTYYYESDRFL